MSFNMSDNPGICLYPTGKHSRGEQAVLLTLESLHMKYETQKRIKYKDITMKLDACLKIGNKWFIIEYNGRQHYEPVARFGGKNKFIKQIERDNALRELVSLHENLYLLEIDYKLPIENISTHVKNFILENVQ